MGPADAQAADLVAASLPRGRTKNILRMIPPKVESFGYVWVSVVQMRPDPNWFYTSGTVIKNSHRPGSGEGHCEIKPHFNMHPEITCFNNEYMRNCYARCMGMGKKCAFITMELAHKDEDQGKQYTIYPNLWDNKGRCTLTVNIHVEG